MKDKKEEKGIKTFLAERKPEPVKVFQFTKEMLPETLSTDIGYLAKIDKPEIFCGYKKNKTVCYLPFCNGNNFFEVGDYIGENREGNYFVIKKEEFEKNYILSCGHTIKEHEQFSHLSPEEQEILQHQCNCEVQE